ncbi:MAG TPA: 30S ribosomal protein S16 [Candidatus Omnitrophota bacterium]|nr:30S ribosomal protein S16 [Candidatus Omnitrophota bacterium]
MAVRIRMKRFGSKNRPQWRIVVSDTKMPRDGRFIEEIGYYDALPKEDIFVVKQERLDYWVKQGAQMSVALKSLVRRQKKKQKKSA